ncbi:required for meiotic nuclear division protein 1 homolog [Condylostylus longicornis]|uniref:required for meiotic nuclear division protein 1 homolog n=1 Tax=Condylostylus longicornis TaxID=2530218 RepID=UPI00244E068A|nr:required for meiotic nuclear division protein 1 homolog [Condylostylus longicornis]
MYQNKLLIKSVFNLATNCKHINFKYLKTSFNLCSNASTKASVLANIPKHGNENIMSRMKRRQRVKSKQDTLEADGYFSVNAFATAEEYNLESLFEELEKQNLYVTKKFFSTDNLGAERDVLYIRGKYEIEQEPRDIFFFREGCVVLWNCSILETNNILNFIKNHEQDRYPSQLIQGESEVMPYSYVQNNGKSMKSGTFFLTNESDNFLQKYTFSNAMSATVKLGICEAILDLFVDDMEFIAEDLKKGRSIRISRAEVLRKTGELFALRHLINLSSDLLDTPDFYWDREELESIYIQVCGYFNISRRTKVMNEKLNHLIELAHLVSSNLNDAHHVRLEWMIIVLIMVEVAFEILHYAEKFF